jgi:hypothetical protein
MKCTIQGEATMRLFVTVCMLALLTSACSKVPSQSSYPYSYQNKVQSADHWERLAKDVVSEQILPFLKKDNKDNKVYIQQKDRSDFGIAFNTYLLTELYDRGINVAETNEEDAAVLGWSVQRVRHASDRKNPSPPAGIFGRVGYLAMEFVGGDFYYASSKVPNSELIISTKLHSDAQTVSMKTETFYVEDRDTGNYWFIEGNEEGLAYVKKGSVICKDQDAFYSVTSKNSYGTSRLSTLKALGECAVMSKNHPVEIVNNDGQSIVIRSIDNADTYVTSLESTSPI